MRRVCLIAGILLFLASGFASSVAAQDGPDLIGVLVLNGKGFATGHADVTIRTQLSKQQEPIAMDVCAPGDEAGCKVFGGDDNRAARVSTFEYPFLQDDTLVSWEVVLTLHTLDGDMKPCFAAGTTLPAVVSCGPSPNKQTVRFNLTGGGQ